MPRQLPPHAALRLVWTLPVTSPLLLRPPTPTQGAPGLWMGSSWQPGPQVCRLSPLFLLVSASALGLPTLASLPPSNGAGLSSGSDYVFSPSGSPRCSRTTRPPWNAWAAGKWGGGGRRE